MRWSNPFGYIKNIFFSKILQFLFKTFQSNRTFKIIASLSNSLKKHQKFPKSYNS